MIMLLKKLEPMSKQDKAVKLVQVVPASPLEKEARRAVVDLLEEVVVQTRMRL